MSLVLMNSDYCMSGPLTKTISIQTSCRHRRAGTVISVWQEGAWGTESRGDLLRGLLSGGPGRQLQAGLSSAAVLLIRGQWKRLDLQQWFALCFPWNWRPGGPDECCIFVSLIPYKIPLKHLAAFLLRFVCKVFSHCDFISEWNISFEVIKLCFTDPLLIFCSLYF